MGFNIAAQVQATIKPAGVYLRFRDLLVCSNCEEAVVAVFDSMGNGQHNSPQGCGTDPTKLGWHLTRTYPLPPPSKCPAHTPDDLKRLYLQAANALKRGDPDASGAMSRKVVDVSTQTLLGEKSKDHKNIYSRIEALAENGALTPDLKDWAHEVRLGGADAAHDLDPFTQAEADELLNFAELYLIYVYSLPGRLKERRERAEREKATKADNAAD